MGNYTIFLKFKNPRRGRQARNLSENDSKILDLKSSSEQIIYRKLSLGAPGLTQRMSSNRYLVQAVKLFSTRFFVLLKKKGFHLFVLKVVMTCFIWVSLKFQKNLRMTRMSFAQHFSFMAQRYSDEKGDDQFA